MKKSKTLLSLLLAVLLLLSTAMPAFAARPREKIQIAPVFDSEEAVDIPEGTSTDVNWEAVMNDVWNLLFTGEPRSIDVSQYQIPVDDSNFIYKYCHYSPRFLRIKPVYHSYRGNYISSISNKDFSSQGVDYYSSDPAANRAKYDACMDAMDQLMFGIKGNTQLSDVDKCLLLHDRLAAWVTYDTVNYYAGTLPEDAYSPYGPLVQHIGVCNGYALAYNWMLDELGFTTYYTSSKDGINHGWSKVKLNDQYYYVDVTWDDPTEDIPGRVTHNQFMLSGQTCSERHKGAADFDLTPNDTTYETYFSDTFSPNITSEIVLIGDKFYYFTDEQEGYVWNLMARNVGGNGSQQQLLQVSRPQIGTTLYYCQPRLVAIGTTILYTSGRTVRAYDTLTGTDSLANYTPEDGMFPENNYFLRGLRQVDGTVYVTSGPQQFDQTTVSTYTESFTFCSHTSEKAVLSFTTGADCQTHGDAKLICPDCRKLFDGAGQGPTGAHAYTAQTVKDAALKSAATCIAPATYYYSCAACGAVEADDAHTFTVGGPADHSWSWVTDIEPTCGAAGTKHQKCANCPATQNANTSIPATGNHAFTAATVKPEALKSAATCTAPATYYYSCTGCGTVESNASHTFTNGAAADHVWEWVIDTNATCAVAGVKHQKCKNCPATQNANTSIPATGNHAAYGSTLKNKVDPGCTTGGYTGDTVCNGCGTVLSKGHAVDALGHTEPNAKGNCERCGTHLKDVEQAGDCKYCGETHSGFGGIFIKIIHSILALFGLRK